MKNSEYWKKRFVEMEEATHQTSVKKIFNIQEQFDKSAKVINEKINAWYQRYAENNNMSMLDAKKSLNAKELKELKWDVEEYIKKGKENAFSGEWVKELENASARAHISRLEALELQCRQQAEVAFGNLNDEVSKHIKDVYKESYYRTAYEIQKGIGVGSNFAALNDRLIEKVVNKPWLADGKNFSDRIWNNKTQLINQLHTSLSQMCITGAGPDKAINQIASKMNVSKANAGRLVMTESAYFSSTAQKECFKELDVERYEIVATLDGHTSDICQEMDGKVFKMSEYEEGVTAPPFHVNCRSCTAPYFDDEFTKDEQRIARDEDGNNYYVPADMTYPEWKKSFVDGQTDDLKETKTDDTISLKNKISEQDNRIDELKNQFSDATDGYSYDEWFSEFSSIEEGYGDASDGDATFTKLKNLDEEIRNAEKQRSDLLLQKESRGQLDTGFPGKVPNDKLDEYNAKAFEQIKVDTGYSEEQATEFHSALKEYFGGDYASILAGEGSTVKTIRDGLDRMPVYDGTVYRGLCFSESSDYDISEFTRLKPGDKIPSKGIISSWSSDKRVAEAFGAASTQAVESSTVILECLENKTGVGVQHISSYGSREAEVLCGSKYEVLEIVTESKYDYVSRRKDLLYFSDDLTEWEDELKKQVVCVIKVKEV